GEFFEGLGNRMRWLEGSVKGTIHGRWARGIDMRQFLTTVMWTLAFSAPAWAQSGGDAQKPPGDGQQQDDEARRREWRDRMDRMRNASPEARDQMRADGYVRMLTRTYELTDEQQKQVREEVVRSEKEYREALGGEGEKR